MKNGTQTMHQNMLQIIDSLNLDGLPKQFMISRWLDQLMWMEKTAKKNQRRYYAFRLACIIGGVMIPALVSANTTNGLGDLIRLATVVLSLIVAVSAAIEEFFHFGERWRHYRRTAELLKSEGWAFFQLTGLYQAYADHARAYPEFAGRVEEAVQKEVEMFITKVSKEKDKKGEQADRSEE